LAQNNIGIHKKNKETGIIWLGKVPSHWTVLPGKACFTEKKISNKGMVETKVLSLSYGNLVVKPEDKLHGLVPESFETYQIVEPGDIIFRTTDLQNDWNSLRFGISRHKGIITSAYMCLRTKPSLIDDYGHQLLHSYDLKKIFYGMGSGLRQNIDWRDIKYLPCLVPPLEEQNAIVRFLDYTDRRIKRYIRAKQKLIKLLEEEKQAIIHQAVTRGLNPDVPMKPSGVEWLGDIPKHWEAIKLKNVTNIKFSNVDKHVLENEFPVRLCNYVDVYKNDRITDDIQFMKASATKEEIKQNKIEIDDVLITKDSEMWNDIGVPTLVQCSAPDLICGYHLAILRPNKSKIQGIFLFSCLSSKKVVIQFHINANGITRYGLSQNSIKNVIIPLPQIDEQLMISKFIDEKLGSINKKINEISREIILIKEYSTRLIADVVTGKLDVRAVASQLPEDIEEEEIDIDDEPEEDDELEEALEP